MARAAAQGWWLQTVHVHEIERCADPWPRRVGGVVLGRVGEALKGRVTADAAAADTGPKADVVQVSPGQVRERGVRRARLATVRVDGVHAADAWYLPHETELKKSALEAPLLLNETVCTCVDDFSAQQHGQ